MLRLTTSLTTIPHHCDHLSFLPRSLSPSLFLHPPSLAPRHHYRASIYLYIPFSLELFASLFVPSARFLPVPLPPTPPSRRPPLSRSLLCSSFLYLSFCLSYPLFAFPVLRLTRAPPRSPSHSRLHRTGGVPADFAFKFGKFAGVGK